MPTRGSLTSETQIEIVWTALTTALETGGTPIVSYYLQWDKGLNNGDWYDLVGLTSPYTSISFIVTTDVTPG